MGKDISQEKSIHNEYPESCVYWLYLKDEHTNPLEQGYVGICVYGAEKRFKQHQRAAKRGSELKVHRAIRKYGERVAVKTLVKGSPEYCLFIESRLRPTAQMKGTWNIGAGGKQTTLGYKHSEESKLKVSLANKGKRKWSEEDKLRMSLTRSGDKHPLFGTHRTEEFKAAHSAFMTGRKQSDEQVANHTKSFLDTAPWNMKYSDDMKYMWKNCDVIYALWSKFPNIPRAKICEYIGMHWNENVQEFIRRFRKGYVPLQDYRWTRDFKENDKSFIENLTSEDFTPKKEAWRHKLSKPDTWALANEVFRQFKMGAAQNAVEVRLGLPQNRLCTMFKMLKSGWNPSEDPSYLAWLSEYKKECNESTLAT